jgi:hypothetical protein
MRFVASSIVLVACALGVSGCYSKATAYQGKFTFAYASMVEHDNFVKPIAVGAKLEVHAFENGSTEQLTTKSARSSNPNVLAVQSVKDKSVILLGKEPGAAEIEIVARDANGKELVDKMFFHVARPASHGLANSCTDDSSETAVYVRGEDAIIDHSMKTSDQRSVVGADYLPLKIEPAGAFDLFQQPQAGGYYWFKAKAPKDKITIRSTIDGKSINARIIDRKDLKDASLFSPDRMLVGQGSYVVAQVRAGSLGTLCNQTALTRAKSLTPEICRVTAKLDDDPDEDDENREQLAVLRAAAFGICKFEVTLPELDGGRGVVLKGEVKVGRMEFPGERGTEEAIRERMLEWSQPVATTAAATRDAIFLSALGIWWMRRRRRTSKMPPR